MKAFLRSFLEKDSFATSFSLNCTLNSAQDGWTNVGKTLSTHQLDGDLYTKHQQDGSGSWTGMLNEIMKDSCEKFALSSSSFSEISKELLFSHHFSIERSSTHEVNYRRKLARKRGRDSVPNEFFVVVLFFVAILDV